MTVLVYIRRLFFVLVVSSFCVTCYYGNYSGIGVKNHIDYIKKRVNSVKVPSDDYTYNDIMHLENNMKIVNKFYEGRKTWNTSNLGAILFLNFEPIKVPKVENKYTILVWKHYEWLKRRHISNYRLNQKDPLRLCNVKNCIFTGDDRKLQSADAVVLHLQHGSIPSLKYRTQKQRWIFLTDESPINTFTLAKNNNWSSLSGIFNWSMTYRYDADIPVPYGRTVHLPVYKSEKYTNLTNLIPYWNIKRRDVLVAILMSKCLKYRMDYITELKKHLKVHIYGKCSTHFRNTCPGYFQNDCKPTREYIFYLAFENSKCSQYLSEKVFYHAYFQGAIPIIMGPPIQDCKEILPPHSFLHIQSFSTPWDLAEEIKYITRKDERLLRLHEWRRHFQVLNEHGYFSTASMHYCRVCEAMNYNEKRVKIYGKTELKGYFDSEHLCQ